MQLLKDAESICSKSGEQMSSDLQWPWLNDDQNLVQNKQRNLCTCGCVAHQPISDEYPDTPLAM